MSPSQEQGTGASESLMKLLKSNKGAVESAQSQGSRNWCRDTCAANGMGQGRAQDEHTSPKPLPRPGHRERSTWTIRAASPESVTARGNRADSSGGIRVKHKGHKSPKRKPAEETKSRQK